MTAQLSTRKIDVIRLVAEGKTYKEIAMILGLSAKNRRMLFAEDHSLAGKPGVRRG
jgi:DNA-binding CsgD family transcriptional regulator